MRLSYTFFIAFLFFFVQSAKADPPYVVKVQHYSLGEGLPNRGVLTISQDQQGFVWIGTLSNAYRFDSYTFKSLPYNRNSMPKEYEEVLSVPFIQTDSEGNLWTVRHGMGPQNHLAILPAGQSEFVSFEKLFKRPLPIGFSQRDLDFQFRIASRPNDPIIFCTVDGLIWLHEGKGRFKMVYRNPARIQPQSLFFSPTGNVLLTYTPPQNPDQSELIELTRNGRICRRERIPAHLTILFVDPQGAIYLSPFFRTTDNPKAGPRLNPNRVENLLYRLDRTGALHPMPISWTTSPFPDPVKYSFVESRMVYDATHGLFWFMGANVLFAWHPKEGIVFDLADSGFPISSLVGFNQLFVDKTGAVWISTQNGFLLLTLERNQFQRFLYSPEDQTKTVTFSTRGIVKTGNWLWVNSYNGSRLIDLKTGTARIPKDLPEFDQHYPYTPAILGHDNKIWTTMGDTLVQIDLQTQTTRKFSLNKFHLNCWALWQDGRCNFWMGYDDGITYYDVRNREVQPFTRYNRYPELAKNRIHGFFPDPKTGDLWVAATSGLYLLDTLRGITARFSTSDVAPNHLPTDQISYVHPDRTQPGIYWLTSRTGGLIRWERNTGKWQHFTQQQGLSNNVLYSVHEDRYGRLWLPSNYGLMRFNKYTHQVKNYLPKDGIAHEEFNLTSHFQSANGQIFLGGLNGITSFWPDKAVAEKPIVVPLKLTSYEQLNANTGERRDYLPEFDRIRQIIIPPENRIFSLSFSLLDYRYSQQFRLFYRIVGWQNYWTSQFDHSISFNGIDHGQYQLEVRAQNPNGQWVSETLIIPLIVLKPFYLQTWFLALLALLVAGTVWGIFWWRNKRLIHETKRLEEEVTRRTAQIAKDKAVIEQQAADLQANATLKARFFANVSHEFRTPLTLLLGPLTYFSKQVSDPAMLRLVHSMDRNARQLLTMVSDLLDLSKLDENSVQLVKQPTDLSQLINQVIAMFHSQADYIGLQLTAEGTTEPTELLLDAPKVETVLKNLLTNALRFTPSGGTITVLLHKSADPIQVEVSDTGVGIHPDDLPRIFERYYQSQQPNALLQGGTGIGLALSRDYCRLWGGTLFVESEPGRGSKFSFTIPYQPASLPERRITAQVVAPETVEKNSAVKIDSVTFKVLLVEDNIDMVTYLSTILAPLYQLHTTRNGQEAWQWLSTQPAQELPQLILTDLMMPEMDGMTLVDQIRQHPTLRFIPVLMLTARSSLDVRLEALRLGVADYMTKPFDQDELVTRINNLLDRAQERNIWQLQSSGSETAVPTPISQDEEWLIQIEKLVVLHLDNTSFQVGSLADAVNTSERQLYRRLKKLTGFSPNQFMQEIRLQTAREWLESQRYGTVKEVCFAVGFQDSVYFSRLFLQRFGRYPVSYLRNSQNENAPESSTDPTHSRPL